MATVQVERGGADGPFLILCDHASAAIPPRLGSLGLTPDHAAEHIAWDIGALAVAQRLSVELDSPLVYPLVSRLVIDCNRAPDHPELIVAETEFGAVPGNRAVDQAECSRRIAEVHDRYHAAIERLLAERAERALATTVVAVHSFTPVLRGDRRPWHVGLLHRADDTLARGMGEALGEHDDILVGLNVPYSGLDGDVFYTLGRHAEQAGLPGLMIELRNDLIRDPAGQALWAGRLAAKLQRLAAQALPRPAAAVRR